MSQDTRFHWEYLLILAALFGLLFVLEFIFPSYTPEAHGEVPDTPPGHSISAVTPSDKPESSSEPVKESEKTPEINNIQSAGDFFDSLNVKYQTTILNQLKPDKPRTDIIIRYYVHPPDGNRVYALRDLGFYIHERPVDKQMTSYESNSIFYGDSIKKEDLLIVAYTLIKQGIPIKNIEPSQYHDGWKYNAIEIGADSTILDKEILTLDKLLDLRSSL